MLFVKTNDNKQKEQQLLTIPRPRHARLSITRSSSAPSMQGQ